MTSYADLNPVIDGLLVKGGISAMRTPELFDRALKEERRLQEWFDALGMEIVYERSSGFVIARNRRTDDLEQIAEELGVGRIDPIFTKRHLKHWQSIVLVLLKSALDREKRGEGREEWIPEEEIIEQAKIYFPVDVVEDGAAVTRNIQQILEGFAAATAAPMAVKRSQSGKAFWKGTPWLDLSVTIDEINDYRRRMMAVLLESIKESGEEVPEEVREMAQSLGMYQ